MKRYIIGIFLLALAACAFTPADKFPVNCDVVTGEELLNATLTNAAARLRPDYHYITQSDMAQLGVPGMAIYYAGGVHPFVNIEQGVLDDQYGQDVVDVWNHSLNNSAHGSPTLQWDNGILFDCRDVNNETVSVRWMDRQLFGTNGELLLDWSSGEAIGLTTNITVTVSSPVTLCFTNGILKGIE